MLWKYDGRERPPFAESPAPGQESVWDYPRPPVIDVEPRRVIVRRGGQVIAETLRALRVLETAGAPGIYIPPADVQMQFLQRSATASHCEWKGCAVYFDLTTERERVGNVAWSYLRPISAFQPIAGYLSFYPNRIECFIGDERVESQPGGFYGGWVTSDLAGPIKGDPGTESW